MKRKLVLWEIGGFLFIGIVGAALHFTFELSNYQSMVVAFFSAVNESTWEHLKMVFWPGFFFMLVEYTYVRDAVNNYFIAKIASLLIMPLVIIVGWYGYTPFTGRSIFPVDLALFYLAVLLGQLVSYKLLTSQPLGKKYLYSAIGIFGILLYSFSAFTLSPPRIFLFEHMDLKDTEEYGILDDYEEMRFFTEPEVSE
jgi:hypothetical protein